MAQAVQVVTVEGRSLKLTNLGKVLYPQVGFTKAHVIDYYRRIAPALLPHLRDRPLTLKRYPDGVDGSFFYEKRCPSHRPAWLRTAQIATDEDAIEFCVIDDLPSLVWAANLADLEMHVYLHTAEAPATPTSVVFDLDPGPGAGLPACCDVALALRGLVEELGLRAFVKTSGGKGMQMHVPVHSPVGYAEVKAFARTLGEMVERERPATVTTNMSKAAREGRVLIDWSQNDRHKTTVCVYSLRANPTPTVSTPLTWQEVEQATRHGDGARLVFSPADVLARVERIGDLYAPVTHMRQEIPGA